MLEIKHGGNEPLADAVPLDIERFTFDQLNDTELWRNWKRERVSEIAANPALADSYESAGFGGLVIEARK